MKKELVESLVNEASVLTQRSDRQHYFEVNRKSILDFQAFFQRFPRLYQLLFKILTPTVGINGWPRFIRLDPGEVVLNLGCGTQQLDPDFVNIDFVGFPHVDIVADLEKPLPLKSGVADAAICISVLEHLRNPDLLIEETARVLKPGGRFYLSVPFVYPFHAAPSDYYRWTPEGLEEKLSAHFDTVEAGPRGGPWGDLVLTLAHIGGQLLSFGNESIYRTLNHLTLALLFWVKYLDLLFCRLPFNRKMATSIYGFARKNPSVSNPSTPE